MTINQIRRLLSPFYLSDLKCFVKDYLESKQRIKKNKRGIRNLRKVRISVQGHTFGDTIQLQSEHRKGIVNKTFFATTLFPDVNVVINNPNHYIPLVSRTGENWLIHIEPPGYIRKLGYNLEKKHKRFSRVYTSDPELYSKGGKYIPSPPFVHWHIELKNKLKFGKKLEYDYDFFKSQNNAPKKSQDLVAINSNINNLPGHKERANFIKKLCETNFPFSLYGGTNWDNYKQFVDNAIDGKWPVYSKSKYVLVIENEIAPLYWSEKITDAILCWSMPIYYGCPNIEEYLPSGSYIKIDIKSPNAIEILKKIIESNYYEENISNLAKARELILDKYNLLNFLDSELNNIKQKS